MNRKNDEKNDHNLALAAAFSIQDLKGWLSKNLVVPPGRKGIALFRDGRTEIFQSGENRVITDLDRFKGLGGGFWAGYIPSASFPVMLSINNLLSGDDQLLDLSLLCQVSVVDATRFFTDLVIPRRKITGTTLILDEPELFKAFANLVRLYTAQDLVEGNLDAQLISRAYALIAPVVQNRGLNLENIDLLTCWRQEDRLIIDQQVFALEQKMADLEFEKQLAEAEDTGKTAEFMRANGVNVNAKFPTSSEGIKDEKQPKKQILKAWLDGRNEKEQPGRNFRVKSLVNKEPPPHSKVHKKVRWWVPRTLWIIAAFAIGVILTIILVVYGERWGWERLNELYIPIWVFVLGAILESVTALFKLWEKNFKNEFQAGGPITLDELRIKDRKTVDIIVRNQCKLELGLQRDMLNDARGRIYQGGNTTQALDLRRIEKKLEDFQDKVQDENFGKAPYLSPDIVISRETWVAQMENEEVLLIEAARLTEKAQQIQSDLDHASVSSEALHQYETNLDAFYKSFAIRERLLFSGSSASQK